MSKSLARVTAALQAANLPGQPLEMSAETRTAADAAAAAGCALDQIVKSILLQGASGQLYLFLTAGGNQVDQTRAAALVGEALTRADPQTIRTVTGFAIGGVAPIGHLSPLPAWIDRRLADFPLVWAAAGTPRHIFPAEPVALAVAAGAEFADFISSPA